MGLFDRFRKKPTGPAANLESPKKTGETDAETPVQPKEDTMCLLLMDRVLDGVDPAVELLRKAFGEKAVGPVDNDHPRVPAFTVTIDGLEFWVSYLPMPMPDEDIPTSAKYSYLLTPEEKQAFCDHKSFWTLAQKGGGTSLSEKRRVCWTFSRLCAALLELEGAVGVQPLNRGGLLLSRRYYLDQYSHMKNTAWDNGDGYFPVPLWVWIYGSTSEGEKNTVQTCGLQDFGLPELGFFNPERSTGEILEFLCTMSCFQITGRQRYRNAILVPLDEKTEVICKESDGTLFFIGA